MKKSVLYLFTAEFPFGNGETFIEAELEYLSKTFDEVKIFPYLYFGSNERHRTVPVNCTIHNFKKNAGSKSSLVKNASLVTSMMKGNFSGRPFSEKKNLLHEVSNYISIANQLESYIGLSEDQEATFYTYWFDHWSSILGVLRKKNRISEFCTRAHGFDLYDYRHKYPIPFRDFQMKMVSNVYTISESGSRYLIDKFPSNKEKIQRSYLGTKTPINVLKKNDSEELIILTVSSLHPVKRIGHLIQSLNLVKRKVKWIHFGNDESDSQFESELKNLPDNIDVDWNGIVTNSELREFIESNKFDLFLNVSESEGLPVSIMEAISFGIPIVATDVGGTSEIVKESTGVLISKDFNFEELASIIEGFSREDFDSNKIHQFWKENFCAEINYSNFAKLLMSNN